MKCPACGKAMRVQQSRLVRGLRYGAVPGRIRVYFCVCGGTERTREIKESLIEDMLRRAENARQEWIREKAALKQEIYLLRLPERTGETRYKKIRVLLLDAVALLS